MAKHQYEVIANCEGGHQPIIWLTDHPQTAHRWYRELCETGRPIDGGPGKVTIAGLYRDGIRVKAASVGCLKPEHAGSAS